MVSCDTDLAKVSLLDPAITILDDPFNDCNFVSTEGQKNSSESENKKETKPKPKISDDTVQQILSRLKMDENECLTPEQKIEVKALIIEYPDLFCDDEPSIAQGVEHVIETGSVRPIYLSPYRASPKERQVIEQEIEKMLSNHIVRPSRSPWSFPWVLVKKKDNSVRFCVDYCRLNEVTKRDVYPLPRIDDAIDALSSANICSTFDLKSAYWQIKMAEHDIEKIAFITHTGLFEFLVMPYSLVNGQATLQCQVDNFLAGLLWIICLCFVDDLNVFSTFTDDLRHLRLVFDRFRQGNFSFNPDKCNLFKESTQYLGCIVMKGGRVQPDPRRSRLYSEFLCQLVLRISVHF